MPVANQTSMVRIEIFDPPMCCSSGLCGPSIDPALLEINDALLQLKKAYDSTVTVERYSLNQHGMKFMQHAELFTLITTQSISILPVSMVNGKIVKQKSYPSYAELTRWISEEMLP